MRATVLCVKRDGTNRKALAELDQKEFELAELPISRLVQLGADRYQAPVALKRGARGWLLDAEQTRRLLASWEPVYDPFSRCGERLLDDEQLSQVSAAGN